MNLISVQSHVAYGHVGNSAAVFPLQRLGVEVWPIHTVQFSNHPGYGSWKGDVFGGEYPGGALYTKADWIASHEKEVQAMTNAIVATLKWIHSHTPEQIADKMPAEFVGKDKALYVAALKNTLPMYSETGRMDPKGASAVLAVFAQSSPDVAKANIDLSKTYTNKYVEAAGKGM